MERVSRLEAVRLLVFRGNRGAVDEGGKLKASRERFLRGSAAFE